MGSTGVSLQAEILLTTSRAHPQRAGQLELHDCLGGNAYLLALGYGLHRGPRASSRARADSRSFSASRHCSNNCAQGGAPPDGLRGALPPRGTLVRPLIGLESVGPPSYG